MKYETDGGPGFVECFKLVSQYSAMPAVDQRSLLKWLFFNLYTGNNDSHAKNLALLNTKSGLRLAPFYDLMCTRLYSGLGRHFAFQIGGEYEPGNLQASHFETLAAELGITFKYLKKSLMISPRFYLGHSIRRVWNLIKTWQLTNGL